MIFKKQFCPVVRTGIRLCLAKDSAKKRQGLGAVGMVFALGRHVFGGKEKGGRGKRWYRSNRRIGVRVLLDREEGSGPVPNLTLKM